MSRLSNSTMTLLTLLLLLLSSGAAVTGCAFDEATAGAESAVSVVDHFSEAQHALGQGDIHAARVSFGQVLPGDAAFARAQVGLALVELMLLPEHPGATSIFTALGADTARLPIDVEGSLYGDDGLFARLHTGASHDLVEAALYEALPWTTADLRAGSTVVFAGLDPEVTLEALRPGVVELEDALAGIEARLAQSLDRGLDVYELPAGFMHAPRGRTLRRSEVLTLRASLGAARATIRLALAYDWPVPMRAALAELDDRGEPLSIDALATLWNDHVLRGLHADSGLDQLAASRVLFADALTVLIEALEVGRAEERRGVDGPIEWLILDDGEASDIHTLLVDIMAGVTRATPVQMRLAAPLLYWTAAPLFNGQVVRYDDALPLFVPADGLVPALVLDDDALHELFVVRMFEPAWSPDSPPDLLADSDLEGRDAATLPLQRFGEELSSDYNF